MRKLSYGIIAAAGVLALGVGSVSAHVTAPRPAVDISKITSGTYTTDAAHSLVSWKVDHFGFNDYFGLFGDVKGTLTLDTANPSASKVDVTIPVSKLVVPSEGLKNHMLAPGKDGGKPDFFGPNPADARFVSTSVTKGTGNTATILGNLTLNGVTKPVTVAAELAGAGNNMMNRKPTVGFHGTAVVKRSDFGLTFGLPGLGDNVAIEITVAFEKPAA